MNIKTIAIRKSYYDQYVSVHFSLNGEQPHKYGGTSAISSFSIARLERILEDCKPAVEFGTVGMQALYEIKQDKTVQRMLKAPLAKARMFSLFKLLRSDTVALLTLNLRGTEYTVEIARPLEYTNHLISAYSVPAFFSWDFYSNQTVGDAVKSIQHQLTYWEGAEITGYHWVTKELEDKL